MEKIPFNISASTQGSTALIRITGTIGWDTDCEQFRTQMDGFASQGITNAHFYLNGPGGSCFDAEEIVHIARSVFTGKITGEGGSLVASAYTRIALMCDSFVMPENGMFMIHKPRGGAYGTANQIASSLKLLSDIDAIYLNLYKTKATDVAKLEAQWQAGDWWMTATEAKAEGYITDVKGKYLMTSTDTSMIAACGCESDKIPKILINPNNKNKMDLKAMATSLGLPESASEAEVTAAIAAGKKAQTDLLAMQEANAKKEKDQRAADIKARLDKAQLVDKVITGDTRASWEGMLDADYDNGIKALDGLSPVKKIDVVPGAKSATGAKGTTYLGKTFAELQDENPEALAALEASDPEAFEALFKG